MKKRALAILVALSLVTSSTLVDFGRITVSAETVDDESVLNESEVSSDDSEGTVREDSVDVMPDGEQMDEIKGGSEPDSSFDGSTSSSELENQGNGDASTEQVSDNNEEAEQPSNEAVTREDNIEFSEMEKDDGFSQNISEGEPTVQSGELPVISDDELQGNEGTSNEQKNENIDVPEPADNSNADGGDIESSEIQEIEDDFEGETQRNEIIDSIENAGDRNIGLTKNAIDESNYIVKTKEVNGMFYNVDSDYTLNVWGENITQIAFKYSIQHGIKTAVISGKLSDKVEGFFNGFTSLEAVTFNDVDTTEVKSMKAMFAGCSSLKTLDLRGFDTSNVTCMQGMFLNCSKLEYLDMSSFDTSNVTDMYIMFSGCSNLNSLDLSSFDTANVTDMLGMFSGCSSMTSLDVSSFDTSNTTQMWGMFEGCSRLNGLDLSGFDTSNVEYMGCMFKNCAGLKSLDIGSFDTSTVKCMDEMFRGCENLDSLNVSSFDTSNVTSMKAMFCGCKSLKSLDLRNFDTSKTTDICIFYDEGMFSDCASLTSLNLSSFNTSNIASMDSMFSGCKSLTSLDLSSFDTSKVNDMGSMFRDCSVLKTLDLSNFNTSFVSDMGGMFQGCRLLESIELKNLDTSKVNNMYCMFMGCGELTSLDLRSFNTASATSMAQMFQECFSLTSLNLSSFDTSNVTSMQKMFYDCGQLKTLDLSSFDNSKAKNVKEMLSGCVELGEIISPRNVSKKIELPGQFYIDYDGDGIPGSDEVTMVISVGDASLRHIRVGYIPSEEESDSIMEATGMLIHESEEEGGTGYLDLYINKSEFNNSSMTYNHNIAKFACELSTMAYSKNPDAVSVCFKDLGYTYSDSDLKYYEDNNGKFATFWIGNVPLDENTVLVTVLVRGTHGEEWYDNFEPGKGVTHEGFERGAVEVLGKLNDYLNNHDFGEKKVKLLITGHSRGAAVSNLIGYKIDKEYKNFHDLALDDVFVYTYATPNVARVEYEQRINGFDNIYNIVNPEDFVTKVLPSLWGYGRYGKTLVLPSMSNTDSRIYRPYLYSLKQEWKKYFANYYTEEYEPYPLGMSEVSDYVHRVSEEVWTINQYYDKRINTVLYSKLSLHDLYHDTLATYVCGNKYLGGACFFDALIGVYGLLGIETGQYFLRHQAVKKEDAYMDHHFAYGHQAETYMAAMNVISEEELLRTKTMLKCIINCPVDIMITNDNGEKIGEIVENNVVYSNDDISLSVDGDSKTFIVPSGSAYHVTLMGNDTGTMDYSVTEYDCDTLIGNRIYYHELPLSTGTSYEMDIADGATLESLELKDNTGNPIPSQVIYKAESGKLTVDVEVVGKGNAQSFANLTAGDYVTLNAVADEGNLFVGWYDESGTLLSTETEYGFSISKSEMITAKFTEVNVENPSQNGENNGNNENGNAGNTQPQPGNSQDNQNSQNTPGTDNQNGNTENNNGSQNGEGTRNGDNGNAGNGGNAGNAQPHNGNNQPAQNNTGTNGQNSTVSTGGSDSRNENIPAQTVNNQSVQNNNEANGQNATVNTAGNEKAVLPVGTEFTSAGKVYRVTGDDTLAVIKLENKKAKTCSIPSSIVHEGQAYSVTEVGSKAFKGMKKLKSATIPSTVTSIGSKAFYNCPNLSKVTIKANKSLSVGKSAFKKISKSGTIKVKGVKKKAKETLVKKIQKQTNGTVK